MRFLFTLHLEKIIFRIRDTVRNFLIVRVYDKVRPRVTSDINSCFFVFFFSRDLIGFALLLASSDFDVIQFL